MGLSTQHVVGERRKIQVKTQLSTLGTYQRPTDAAPGSIETTGAGLTISHSGGERIDRAFTNSESRGISSRVTGKKSTDFSLEIPVKPSGTAGTPPEAHALFVAILAGYTNTPATSDVYTASNTQGAGGALSITDHAEAVMKAAVGAWVNELKISQSGPTPPSIAFSGLAKDLIYAGRGVVAGGGIAGAVVTLDSAADAKAFRAGALVCFKDPTTGAITSDNSGEGWQISSISGANLTLEGAPTGADAADIVEPFTPGSSYLGSVLGGLLGSVTITPASESGISPSGIEKIEIVVNANATAIDTVAFSATPIDYVEGRLTVQASISVLLTRAEWQFLGRHAADPSSLYALEVIWGSTAGARLRAYMAQAELSGFPTEFPASGLCKATLQFTGLCSAVDASDAIELKFY